MKFENVCAAGKNLLNLAFQYENERQMGYFPSKKATPAPLKGQPPAKIENDLIFPKNSKFPNSNASP